MTYEEALKQIDEAATAHKAARDTMRRVIELAQGDAPPNMNARLTIAIDEAGAIQLAIHANAHVGPFDASTLTTEQAIQVLQAREIFRQWQAGRIEKLPDAMLTIAAWDALLAVREQTAQREREEVLRAALEMRSSGR